MAQQKFTNNAASKLASSLTTGSTTLSVTATEGAKFPTLAAGEWSMVNLIKLVAGLPVTEIVKVTARSGDLFTILRAQEGTTATTFAAGDLIELRPTAGGLSLMAQRDGDNTYSASNTFNGNTFVPTQSAGDNSGKAASTAYADTAANARAEKGVNNSITQMTGLTTPLSIPQGGTGANAAVAACVSLGAVQNGTGVGQAPSNAIKIGWGSGGGGLLCTVDASPQGYFAFSSTNPNGGGTLTFANLLALQNGLTVSGAACQLTGGAVATLSNNGYLQIGTSGGLNLVADTTQLQARSNGAAATLNLNALGGLVQIGAGGLNSAGTVNSAGVIYAQSSTDQKIGLYQGATARGFINANASYCFIAVNAANSLQGMTVDNSGNVVAAGNVTAFSDSRLKADWQAVDSDFVEQLAQVQHGSYTRTDTGERQAGVVAQDVAALLPAAVAKQPNGFLALNYGGFSAVAVVQLAREVVTLREQMQRANDLIQRLMDKAGA